MELTRDKRCPNETFNIHTLKIDLTRPEILSYIVAVQFFGKNAIQFF